MLVTPAQRPTWRHWQCICSQLRIGQAHVVKYSRVVIVPDSQYREGNSGLGAAKPQWHGVCETGRIK